MNRLTLALLSYCLLAGATGHGQSLPESWHQWRGPENNGVSRTAKPPLEWSETKNLRWKAEIKGKSTASPIVWGDKVFVTTSINTDKVDPSLPKPDDQPERVFGIKFPNTSYEMVVLCFDRKSGKLLWRERAKTLVPHEGHHKDASFASASPFCDGERLYCWFGSAGLFAYSLDGKKLWERDLGLSKMGASLGEGSSPVVHHGKLVIVRDHAGQSSIECLDATTGKTLWKEDREEGNAWATPAIAVVDGRTQVITCASNQVRSYDLETGEVIWWASGLTGNCAPCPIVDLNAKGGPTVYCMSGYEGHALLAIPITGKNDVTDTIRWKVDRGTPYVPSPILYDGQLYFTQSNQGILTSLQSSDGSDVFERTRVPDLGDIYASPVGADGRIYFSGRKGTTVVIERSKEFKVLATNQLDDNFHTSPALAGNQLFLRGMRFLYCLEKGSSASGSEIAATPSSSKQQPSDPKKALGAKLRGLVDAGKITGEESIELYLTAFPEEEENVKRWLASLQKKEEKEKSKLGSPKPPSIRELLEQIAQREIPKDYSGGDQHQPFVDSWFAKAPPEQVSEVGRLWKEQGRLFPDMKNRGESFIRILDYVRSDGKTQTNRPAGKSKAPQNPPIKKLGKSEIRHEPGKPLGKSGTISGLVRDAAGKPIEGVMVSAFDEGRRQSVSIFSQADGRFLIADLQEAPLKIRARLPGKLDHWIEEAKLGDDVAMTMKPATGDELEAQRPASDAFAQLKFESPRDRLNFKMNCSYCHQIGTAGFRTPEKPVDWETMIKRMDGFGGLYQHTKQTIVQRIIDTYKDDAVEKWPQYVPPPAPSGLVTRAKITSWEVGDAYEGSYHDLELGPDGIVYAVNISRNELAILDPQTGAQTFQKFPRGTGGAHSIERANDGSMWTTMCGSGHMARYDPGSGAFLHVSSAEAPAKRGSYPHTLRINPNDPEGLIWYTDAGRNSVFSLHPKTHHVKEYDLLDAGQVSGNGKGESRGITPYGLDYSPVDGMIWYSKLNGNRIGRIDPNTPDGAIVEWNPPFRGPRRLHVAPDGIVWVPGFGSGVFGKFDPKTEKWATYPLPDYLNQIPYALNVAPDGMVWICGTGNDTLYRFNPETEYLVEFPLPYRVSYTREIEFDNDGNVWTSTSGLARHMENVCGTIIKLEILDGYKEEVGGMKLNPIELSPEEQGLMTDAQRGERNAKLGSLLARIEALALPKEYRGETHQDYVNRVMATLTEEQRARVGGLWKQRREADSTIDNQGQTFVRILDYVASGAKAIEMPAESGPDSNLRPKAKGEAKGKSRAEAMEKQTSIHRLENPRRSPFDAFLYVNRIPDQPREDETAHQLAGRIHGRLANQEGRVLLKLPPGMSEAAYRGFKTFLGSEGNPKITNCAACHSPPAFGIAEGNSLRTGKWSSAELETILKSKIAKAAGRDAAYAGMRISEDDIADLIAFQETLKEVNDESFRDLILSATVVDVAAAPKTTKMAVPLSLSGSVRFEGPRPERKPLPMDEASRKLYDGKSPLDEATLISKSGGLANVFVFVKNPPKGDYRSSAAPAVIDQQKSMFRPRVQGLRVGEGVVMKNGDPFIHNIRSLSRKNRPFNIAQPAGAPDRKRTFEVTEGPITIKCDFHRWMTAHFFVMDHPFFAVTDPQGRFEILRLPPGGYTLAAWHEVFGELELKVTTGKGATSETGFTFRPKEN